MFITIGDTVSAAQAGNKASVLCLMKQNGFRVPDGFILTKDVWEAIVSHNQAQEKIEAVCAAGDVTEAEKSRALQDIIGAFMLPGEISAALSRLVDADKRYAVRSSGMKEDLAGFSFAGQYESFLNVQGQKAVSDRIVQCYQSMAAETVLTYLSHHVGQGMALEMAVIVQEMVGAEKSGVVFTINPITGNDKEFVIEAISGLGDQFVGGYRTPERYRYDWFAERYTEKGAGLLGEQELERLLDSSLALAQLFGYPCDIEFAIQGGNVFILQARAITRVMYQEFRDLWSTADFRDGGVSAGACLPFMWSLYESVWEPTLKKFLLDSHLAQEKKLRGRSFGEMYYGRPYWNLSIVKEAMAMVPGYREREFDQEFGVNIIYAGDGKRTRITPKSLYNILRIALAQKKIVRERMENVAGLKHELMEIYEVYKNNLNKTKTMTEWEADCKALIQTDYLKSEGIYFTQIFINTVHQALFKNAVAKITDDAGYLTLLSGLDDISHLLPIYDMWDITRKIRRDVESTRFWRDSSPTELREALSAGEQAYFLPEFGDYIMHYGYHSQKELDIAFPCYDEDIEGVAAMFQGATTLDDLCDPRKNQGKQKQAYEGLLMKLEAQLGKRKWKTFKAKIAATRNRLWWREEFRDVSTRYYYLIRKYIQMLAGEYERQGILEDAGDIWYIKTQDLWDFMNQKTSAAELNVIISRNKAYYRAFCHYNSAGEIGAVFNKPSAKKTVESELKGIGCNSGIVTGTARVVKGIEEIGLLQKDDILIALYTDTGWTSKFSMLKGLVTERGGILCHAAIVSREYGIPCIVCAQGATERIPDGCTITINGATGEISF